MPDRLLARLSRLPWVMVEYGAESACDETLARVNRCHTWADTADAVRRTHDAGLPVGLHLINGLPGEDEERILATVDEVNRLPVDVVKFHQLQLIRGTRMALVCPARQASAPRHSRRAVCIAVAPRPAHISALGPQKLPVHTAC